MKKLKSIVLEFAERKESILYLVILIAVMGLLGWIVKDLALSSYSSSYIPIAPSTSIIFIVYSLLLFPNNIFTKSRISKIVTIVLTSFIGIFCLLIFLDYFLKFSWDIESLIIKVINISIQSDLILM